jgi:hypothetical protein
MNAIKLSFGLMLLLCLHGLNALSQVWSEPKNITSDSYHDSFPDICIDNNGVLHCVWVKQFETSYRAIYYSKSTNQGYSWYSPHKISPYTTGFAHSPSINSDSLNNLYVIYKYDINQPYQENYYFTKFNGQNWSAPITICNEYPGAFEDEVVMDEHDRLYIFWHGFEHHPFYKYYENGAWSELINIYENLNPSPYVEVAVSDPNNNLHCIGYLSQLPVYLYYNFVTNEWYQPYPIGIQSHMINFEDIAVDNQGNPYLVWREENFSEPGDNATVFRKKTGESWGEMELVNEGFDDLFLQKIDVENDNIFIVDTKDVGDIDSLMFYRKESMSSWYSVVVESYYRIEPRKVLHDNEYLYILMLRQQAYGELLDVYITKAPLDSITTSIKKEKSLNEVVFTLDQNYPNPFINNTIIDFEMLCRGNASVVIIDILGNVIRRINAGILQAGKHSIVWDGNNETGNKVTEGFYYYRLTVENQYLTKYLIFKK